MSDKNALNSLLANVKIYEPDTVNSKGTFDDIKRKSARSPGPRQTVVLNPSDKKNLLSINEHDSQRPGSAGKKRNL